MRIAVIADVHLDCYANTKGHLVDICNAFGACVRLAKVAGADTLVLAGDFLNRRQHIDAVTLYHALKCVRITTIFDRVYFLGGNHEYLSDEYSVLNCIPRISGKIKTTFVHKIVLDNVTLLPWRPDGQLHEAIRGDGSDYLISHFPVLGMAYGAVGAVAAAGVTPADLTKYKSVLLGDFHHQQRRGNVYYAGSPLQHDFGEENSVNGFLILDTNTNEVECHVIPSIPRFVIVPVDGDLSGMADLEGAHVWFKCPNTEFQALVKQEVAHYRHLLRSCRITVEESAPRQSRAAGLDLQLTDLDKSFKRYVKARLTQSNEFKKKVYAEYLSLRKENADRVQKTDD